MYSGGIRVGGEFYVLHAAFKFTHGGVIVLVHHCPCFSLAIMRFQLFRYEFV